MKSSIVCLIILATVAAIAPPIATAQWSPDQKLSTADTSCVLNENMGRCLAVSGDSVYVVWVDGKTGSVYHKHSYNDGLTWSADAVVATGLCAFPSIAAGGGSVHIAYRGLVGKDYYSYYVRSLDGGNNWTAPASLGKFYWWPSITCEGDHVYLAINDTLANTAYNSEVYFLRSMDNGATWDSLVRISTAAGRSEDPSIAAAGGCVHLAWNDNRTGKMQTWYRRSTDWGTTWQPETQVTFSTSKTYCPILSSFGTAVDLAYADFATGHYEVYYNHSTDFGASWSTPAQLTHAGGTAAYPVTVHSGHDLHMVWSGFGNGVMYLHSPYDGVTWDSATSLVSSDGKPSSAFIATGNSKLHLIWLDQRDGYSAVYYKHYSPVRWPIGPVPHRFDVGFVDSGDCYDTAIYFFDTVAIPLKITLDSIFRTSISLDRTIFPVTIGPFGSPMSVLRIPVRCCAEKVQDYYDTVLFTTEDTAAKQEMFCFKWRGVPSPTLSVTRSIVEFGTIDSGATSQQTLGIIVGSVNTQRYIPDSAVVDSVQVQGPAEFVVQTPTTPFKIAPGTSVALTAEFSPVKVGQSSATLSIFLSPHAPWRNFTSHQDTLTVTLNGTGGAPTNNHNSVRLSAGIDVLRCYPNPANASPLLYISSRTNLSDVHLEFYDAAGIRIGAQNVGAMDAGAHTIPLALPKSGGGIFARVLADGKALGEIKLVSAP